MEACVTCKFIDLPVLFSTFEVTERLKDGPVYYEYLYS